MAVSVKFVKDRFSFNINDNVRLHEMLMPR